MHDNGEREPDQSLPAESDRLSDKEITKELRSQALLSPWTVLPLIPLTVSILDLFVVPGGLFPHWMFGMFWKIVSIAILLGSVLVIAISYLGRRYLWHDDDYARELQERIVAHDQQRLEENQAELESTLDALKNGFTDIESEEGLKSLNDLEYEYRLIQPIIDDQRQTEQLSIAHIPGLIEQTYRQGLSVLTDTVRISEVIHTSNLDSLEAEVKELEKVIERMRQEGQIARAEIREATVRSHKERIELLGQQQLRVDELLHQAVRCVASLANTRVKVTALQAGGSDTSIDTLTKTLKATLKQAAEVQEELRQLGY